MGDQIRNPKEIVPKSDIHSDTTRRKCFREIGHTKTPIQMLSFDTGQNPGGFSNLEKDKKNGVYDKV